MKKLVACFFGLVFTVLLVIIGVSLLISAKAVLPPDSSQTSPTEGPKETQPSSTATLTLSREERDALACLVWNEAGLCSDDCQRAIISVTINQFQSGYWGHSYIDIITNESIYVGARYLETATPGQNIYDNIDYVLTHGITIQPDTFYFRANYGWEKVWDGYETTVVYDNVYFGHFVNGNH